MGCREGREGLDERVPVMECPDQSFTTYLYKKILAMGHNHFIALELARIVQGFSALYQQIKKEVEGKQIFLVAVHGDKISSGGIERVIKQLSTADLDFYVVSVSGVPTGDGNEAQRRVGITIAGGSEEELKKTGLPAASFFKLERTSVN